MVRTSDRFPGERSEEGIILEDNTAGDPSAEGGIRYTSGDFKMRDAAGVFNPRAGLPAATAEGQVLFAADGSSFTVETPLTSSAGWLLNEDGVLLVVG